MAYGQLESAWPVSGSVLIVNDEIHCVAGRNMFLDEGLHYLRLDPVNGRKISENVMGREDPIKGGTIQKYDSWLDMTTAMPDVLSCDGTNIYMRSLPFDLKGKRRRITHIAGEQEPPHLFSPTGFLDGSWFHRTYWTYGRTFPGGYAGHLNAGRYNPSGRIVAIDDSTIYAYGRKAGYFKWTTSLEYCLFAVDKKDHRARDVYAMDRCKAAQQKKFPDMKIDAQMRLPSGTKAKVGSRFKRKWETQEVPLLVTAMVSAGDKLVIAGPEDVCNEGGATSKTASSVFKRKKSALERQEKIWAGAEGAVLEVVSKKDGQTVSKLRLKSLPVFDGMIAAHRRLYISTMDGKVLCLGK